MLFNEKNKYIAPDLVLVSSHELANMDAKEQADRMAAAEALFMISTKGKGDVNIPRKSKRGRKSKKIRDTFEGTKVDVSQEISRSKSRSRTTQGAGGAVNKKNLRGHGGEIEATAKNFNLTAEYRDHADLNYVNKVRGKDGALNEDMKFDRAELIFDKSAEIERFSGNLKMELPKMEYNASLLEATEKGDGKRIRSRSSKGQHGSGQSQKSKKRLPSPTFAPTEPPSKSRAARGVRRKSPGGAEAEDEIESPSPFLAETKPLKSKPPPKKLGRFREKMSPGHSSSMELKVSDNDKNMKTEIQALGFTGASLTLVQPFNPKGGKSSFVPRKGPPAFYDEKSKTEQVSSSASTTTGMSSTGSSVSANLTSPSVLPSLTSDVMNLPSLPVGIESLQLASTPLPSLSSLPVPDWKEIKNPSKSLNDSDKAAQKVLPLKKRKLQNQKQEEEKVVEEGSDMESEEGCYGDQDSPASVSTSQPAAVHAKFTVQAPPMVTMQTLMEIHTALTPDEDGDLPLHIAVVHENMRMVTKLINLMKIAVKGVDKFNKQQQTPLHLAVKLDFLPAVILLIASGATVNTVDGTGSSAIHMAVQGGFTDCLEHMLSKCRDVEVNARNFEGLSPLHLAVDNHDVDQVHLLINHGAEIDLVDGKSGRTALFHAAETNQKPMVELLLKKGANPDLPNYAGVTTTMAAQGRSLHSILKLIGSVTQEIKWSFVAVKTNPEPQTEGEDQSATAPSVEVYAGRSLLHSELLKTHQGSSHDDNAISSQNSSGEQQHQRIFQNMLVVKSSGGPDRYPGGSGGGRKSKEKSGTARRAGSVSPSSRLASEVKKELQGHKREEAEEDEVKAKGLSSLSLNRVKVEVVEGTELPSNSYSSEPAAMHMHKPISATDEKQEVTISVTAAGKLIQAPSDNNGERILIHPNRLLQSQLQQSGDNGGGVRKGSFPSNQPATRLLIPQLVTRDKRMTASSPSSSSPLPLAAPSSASSSPYPHSPSSPRTPPNHPSSASSSLASMPTPGADSLSFTSMQARLYKQLLEMYNIKSLASHASSSSPASHSSSPPVGLMSLPAIPTQPKQHGERRVSARTSPSASPPPPQVATPRHHLAPSSSSSAATPGSPAVEMGGPGPVRGGRINVPPFQRSLSSSSGVSSGVTTPHRESEQQTFVLQRNPAVQRISVLPTRRNSQPLISSSSLVYAAAADSPPALQSQGQMSVGVIVTQASVVGNPHDPHRHRHSHHHHHQHHHHPSVDPDVPLNLSSKSDDASSAQGSAYHLPHRTSAININNSNVQAVAVAANSSDHAQNMLSSLPQQHHHQHHHHHLSSSSQQRPIENPPTLSHFTHKVPGALSALDKDPSASVLSRGIPMPPLIHHSGVASIVHPGGSTLERNGQPIASYPSSTKNPGLADGKDLDSTSNPTAAALHRRVPPAGLVVRDLPHITNAVSPKTASLVRTFLAGQQRLDVGGAPTSSSNASPTRVVSPSSSSSISSSSPYPPPGLSSLSLPQHQSLATDNSGGMSFVNSTTPSSLTVMPSFAVAPRPGLENQYIAVTSALSHATVGRQVIGVSQGSTTSDPKFLHQGRIIDLSQGDENSLEALKPSSMSSPHPSLLRHPSSGKVVGFSGAILAFSSSADASAGFQPVERRPERITPVVVRETTPAKPPPKKKRGRRSNKSSSSGSQSHGDGSADTHSSETMSSNKIKHETDRKLKKFLGLKQKETPTTPVVKFERQGDSETLRESDSTRSDPTRTEVTTSDKNKSSGGRENDTPMIETVGIFSGNIQHVIVGKPQSPSFTSSSSSSRPISSSKHLSSLDASSSMTVTTPGQPSSDSARHLSSSYFPVSSSPLANVRPGENIGVNDSDGSYNALSTENRDIVSGDAEDGVTRLDNEETVQKRKVDENVEGEMSTVDTPTSSVVVSLGEHRHHESPTSSIVASPTSEGLRHGKIVCDRLSNENSPSVDDGKVTEDRGHLDQNPKQDPSEDPKNGNNPSEGQNSASGVHTADDVVVGKSEKLILPAEKNNSSKDVAWSKQLAEGSEAGVGLPAAERNAGMSREEPEVKTSRSGEGEGSRASAGGDSESLVRKNSQTDDEHSDLVIDLGT